MYMESSAPEGAAVTEDLSAAWCHVAALVTSADATLGKWLMDTRGIGLTEYRAILHLSRASDKELRIKDLADKVGLNQSSVTRLVERLESKELAVRDTCPDDARGVYAVITERGANAVDAIREPYEAKIRELMQNTAKHYPQLDPISLARAFQTIGVLIS